MMIHSDKCHELGLTQPKTHETQCSYLLKLMSEGHRMNTRLARYIGIGNLHSLIKPLRNSGYEFELYHARAECPFTGEIPPYIVDWTYMGTAQQRAYKERKPAKA